ncbi:MAG: hypothetical protein AABZ23_02365 [Deltaproteobacteria bacterium]
MNIILRKEIISLLEKFIDFRYPLRWADEKTTLGDFDGKEFTIDVFRIPANEQLDFLKTVRPIRDKIRDKIGDDCMFIFHSPKATEKYYSHLFPITKGLSLENKSGISIPLPDNGGTEGSPKINGVYIKYKRAA